MIETRSLKNVVIFIQKILSFVLLRKIINITSIFYENMEMLQLKIHECEKLEYKRNKLKLNYDLYKYH